MMGQQRIGLQLRQKPVFTQSLRQLVKLLALNRLDLRAEINRELEANPLLEADAEPPAPEWESEAGDAGSGNEAADENTAHALENIDFEKFYEDDWDAAPYSNFSEPVEKPSPELFLTARATLSSHLLRQLSLCRIEENVRRSAECIIGSLSDDGYLNISLDEVSRLTDGSLPAAEQALRLVQGFDPLGVAARNLRECLLLQLPAVEGENGLAFDILCNCFKMLERGETARMAALLRSAKREVEQAVERIRELNPRPGQRYQQTQNHYVEPDVYFIKEAEGGFRVVLNDEGLPELRVNRSYRRLLERGKFDKNVRNYIKERYSSAFQLLRNMEQRRQTIRRTCEEVVRRQTAFLANGPDSLRPMMIKDVAEEIGVHASTVSRAVTNKYAHTPYGVYELRFFFSEGVKGPLGAVTPLILLKRRVRQMIAAEDTRKPLTDAQLVKILKDDGIYVTRRSVAKYREDLGIPSIHKRRRKDAVKIWENNGIRKGRV